MASSSAAPVAASSSPLASSSLKALLKAGACTGPGVHRGVVCNKSFQSPIVGRRYTLRGHDYDLCEAEYRKLGAEERRRFERVEPNRFYRRRGEGVATSVPVRAELPREVDRNKT